MPNYLDPRGFQRIHVSTGGSAGHVREGGLTQTGAGGDITSHQRGPSYRQHDIADPKEQTMDNSKTLLYVVGALGLALWISSRS